jgi:alpha 1,6-mannosyltransferase
MHRGVLKADFLRYLVLLVHGGVYSDVDTELLHPIESWGTHSPHHYTLPPLEAYDYAAKPPSVIVGLEVDVHELKWNWDRWWPRPLGVW